MKKNQGFTLIELLVVIAIIGILSAIVLASLNTARAKGVDAAVKAQLSGMRSQAELIFADKSCYSSDGTTSCAASAVAPGACTTATSGTLFNNTNVTAVITAINTTQGLLMACSSTAGQTAWAMVGQYKSNGLKGWCVDSTGKSKEISIVSNDQTGVTAEINASGQCVE